MPAESGHEDGVSEGDMTMDRAQCSASMAMQSEETEVEWNEIKSSSQEPAEDSDHFEDLSSNLYVYTLYNSVYSFYSVYVLIVDFYNYYSECCLCAVPASSAITVQVAQFSDYVNEMQQENQGGNKFVKEFEVSHCTCTCTYLSCVCISCHRTWTTFLKQSVTWSVSPTTNVTIGSRTYTHVRMP